MKITKFTIAIIIISFCIYGLIYDVGYFNLFLHRSYGKDGGLVRQFQIICILSSLFYFFIATDNRLKYLLFGLISGAVSFTVSYLFWYYFLEGNDFIYLFMSSILFIAIYYLLNYFTKHRPPNK